MPNFCSNILSVVGDIPEVARFYNIGVAKELNGDLIWKMSRYFPTPVLLVNTISPSQDTRYMNSYEVKRAKERAKEFPETVIPKLRLNNGGTAKKRAKLKKRFGCDNWYDWNIANWGTKWDCRSENNDFEFQDGFLTVNFESAWSPPTFWLKKVQEDFPTLKFKLLYMEEGCGFAGIIFTDEDGDLCCEQDEVEMYYEDMQNGNIVCKFDAEKEMYIGSDGKEYSPDDVFAKNPFESENVWFE